MEANNKAMREALIKVSEWMAHRIATGGFEASPTIPTVLEDVVLPALSAPPRNCDTDKDGKTLLDDYISMKGITSENQVGALYDLALPVIVWLLSSAAERKGEHDGSK